MNEFDEDVQAALGDPGEALAEELTDKLSDDAQLRVVTFPSGGLFRVHEREYDWTIQRIQEYKSQIHFENVSDLNDLDRVIMYELLIWRWGGWLITGLNYEGEGIDEPSLHKQVKEIGSELRQLKSGLNIDKVSRDRLKGEDSISVFLQYLLVRAKHFGYTRNLQFAFIMETFMELRGLMDLHDGCEDDAERRDQHCTLPDIMKWLREERFPKLDEIDRKFRQDTPTTADGYSEAEVRALVGGQQMWVRSL